MDVQSKINCSLDDLIKLQRKAPRGAARGAVATPQKGTAPQRVSMKGGMIKKPQKPGRQQQQQQQKYNPRQQQQQGNFARQKQQKPFPKQQQQQGRGLSVTDKINLPLETVIAKQQQRQKREQHHQQQQQKGSAAVGKKQQQFGGRRWGFLASRDEQRGGRLRAAAAAAARAAPRGAAGKFLAASKNKGGRIRTPHQQVVETLKSAAAFKSSAGRRNRGTASAFARDRSRAAATTSRGGRFTNGRLPLRRQPGAAISAASRANTSLARRRPLGPAPARRTAPAKTTAAPATARSNSSYPPREQYSATAAATRPLPIDRRRPPASTPAAPSYAADPEILANIKIMATLDTVPAPLPQQRGAHVAIPAAMQQQQQQQPSRAIGGTAPDAGTLSSRFGY